MEQQQIKHVLEAALLAAGRPLSLDQLHGLFADAHAPARAAIREALESLRADYQDRGIALNEVASGFRIEVRAAMMPWLGRLWDERPPRYSRALMETLAIVAYRQPVTRGDIEEVRGVAVTTNIVRTLLERNWIKVVGYRDVPGKPAMYATTREFLDYFGLRQLEDLPPLAEIRDLDATTAQLQLPNDGLASEQPPGKPGLLIRPLTAALPSEPATVSSIEGARETAQPARADSHAGASARVIPLKAR
jgi:segregation and condensation protein B